LHIYVISSRGKLLRGFMECWRLNVRFLMDEWVWKCGSIDFISALEYILKRPPMKFHYLVQSSKNYVCDEGMF
jgi:hypothetical protein